MGERRSGASASVLVAVGVAVAAVVGGPWFLGGGGARSSADPVEAAEAAVEGRGLRGADPEGREPEVEPSGPTREAVAAVPAPEPAPVVLSLAAVVGRVELDDGLPLATVDVRLCLHQRTTEAVTTTTDAEGRFHFDAVPEGRHRLELVEASLPARVVPPQDQARCGHGGNVQGVCAEVGEPSAEGVVEHEVLLRAFRVGRVGGRVLDADGDPAMGVHVRARGADAPSSGLSEDAVTDEKGRFQFVGLYDAGRFQTEVSFPQSTGFADQSRPESVAFEVRAGDDLQLPDLRFRRGTGVVHGRFVDLEERPIVGVPVFCYDDVVNLRQATRTRTVGTDELGAFRFEGLPSGRCSVVVGMRHVGYEELYLGEQLEPLVANLTSSSSVVDLGTIRLDRRHRFDVDVQVGYAGEWGGPPKLRRLELVVRLGDEEEPERVRLDREGRADWWCLTPHDPVTFELRYLPRDDDPAPPPGFSLEPVSRLVVPEANGRASVVLTLGR